MKNILESKQYINDLEKASRSIDLKTLSKSTILITGAAGLIGSAITDFLIVSNELFGYCMTIICADININTLNEKYGSRDDVSVIRYDAMKPIDFGFSPDYIIHSAGIASPELYVKMPVETMLSNFTGLNNLLEFFKSCKGRRLLYISSSEVYGSKSTDNSFLEDKYGTVDISNIRSSYSEAKRASEVLCKSYVKEYGVSAVIVRPGHVFGPTASPSDKRVSSDFVYKAARGENLELKSSGLQSRSYCYSIDCVVAVLTVLLRGIDGEAYNVGHSSVTTIKRLCEMIADAGNVRLFASEPTELEKSIFNPMNNSSLDITKIKNIGYCDVFSIDEGVKHTVSILKELIH